MRAADDEADTGCAGECNYVLRRVERLDAAGQPVMWEVETCTGCGREIAAKPADALPAASLPVALPPASA